MTRMRLDAVVRDAIDTLNEAAEWLEEVAARKRSMPNLHAFKDTARSLRGVAKNLEDSWND